MKTAFLIAVGVTLSLVLTSQLPPTADIVEEAQKYFTSEEIAIGQSFAWQRRWLFWGNVLAQLGLLGLLALSRVGQRLHDGFGHLTGYRWLPHILALGGVYWIASWLIAFPFRALGYYHLQAWEMTDQSFLGWFNEHLLYFGISTLLEGLLFVGLYFLMRTARRWWLLGGIGTALVGFIFAYLLPAVVAPLFNTFTPLSQTEWSELEPRIRMMAKTVGANTSDIFVVDASRQSRHSNAYFTGIGASQRVVLYDNLLRNHSHDEVETVVAHELGHWHHWHILQGIFFGGLAATGGLYLLARYIRTNFVETGHWDNAGDPAGVYRVLLICYLAVAATWPIQSAVSRRFEKQADEISLYLSKKPQAFIEAEIRLARLNKSNVAPSRWNVLLFATHPPVVERIQMAEGSAKQ